MPRGDFIVPQRFGAAQHFIKLNFAVALNAGVGGSAVYIFVYKIGYDVLFKTFLKIKGIVRNTEPHANRARVFHVR